MVGFVNFGKDMKSRYSYNEDMEKDDILWRQMLEGVWGIKKVMINIV